MDNAIKAISKTDTEMRVANYMVLFGGVVKGGDLTGERFVPVPIEAFESEYTKSGVLHVDWEHGLDPDGLGNHKDNVLGYVDWKTARIDEKGLFVERVLSRRAKYMEYLETLIDEGLIGNSSEAVEYKKTKDGDILEWRLRRDSLTVMPAEPRMMSSNAIQAIKSLGLVVPQEDEATDLQSEQEVAETESDKQKINIEVLGVNKMSDETQITEPTPYQKALEDKLSALSGQVETVLKHIQDTPAIKNSGYVSQDGGKADENVKSFGDFLLAVARNDTVRLGKVYGAVKAMSQDSGAGGGYITVPPEYDTKLLSVAYTASPILGLVQKQQVSGNQGFFPSLDITTAPTAGTGNTAAAGRVTTAKRAESGAYTETTPNFDQIEWKLSDSASGYTKASKELKQNSAMAIESLLTTLFGIAISSKLEYFILRGNGVGEPLGILNSDVALAISPTTNNEFAFVDAVNMVSRFKKFTNNVRWVQHPSTLPDYAGSTWVQGQVVHELAKLGYGEALLSEHLPQANNSGHIMLADFGAYMLFEKGGTEISYSEHADFLNGNDVWRFSRQVDGKPWLKNKITLADPQGSYTVSPFVYFND